jgi:hypothetical protein
MKNKRSNMFDLNEIKKQNSQLCKHWYEDLDREICKGNNNKYCTCSGVKYQCNFPDYFREFKKGVR